MAKDKLIQSLKGFFSMLSGLLCIVKKSIKLTQYTIVVNSDVCSTLREHHGLWTPREEIAFTARPKIPSQIFGYGRSIFCLPHRLKFSDIFDLCLHWASVVRDLYYRDMVNSIFLLGLLKPVVFCKQCTGSSCLMRISLLRISLLRFFKALLRT